MEEEQPQGTEQPEDSVQIPDPEDASPTDADEQKHLAPDADELGDTQADAETQRLATDLTQETVQSDEVDEEG